MSQVKIFQFEANTSVSGLGLKHAIHLFLTEVRNIPISKREVKELIDKGKVHLNKSKVYKAGLELKLGDKVLVELPRKFLKAKDEGIEISFDLTESDVVYEDDAIIAVNKPSGLSTQASLDPKRDHLYAAVRRYLEAKSKKEVYVGLHHRLDVDTSGLVVFTKKKSANKGLGNQFEFRKIKKTYVAVSYKIKEDLKSSWRIKNHLARSKQDSEKKMLRMESVKSGGDPAETFFDQVSDSELQQFGQFPEEISKRITEGDLIAVVAKPKTGRTHQIRVHLFEFGLPILGDRFYYLENKKEDVRLHLHAYQLELNHPITEEPLVLKAPVKF